MNAIGIDVSKDKSTVAVIRPFGEIVRMPFDVAHTSKDLNDLAKFILSLEGESRVVLEHTASILRRLRKVFAKPGYLSVWLTQS